MRSLIARRVFPEMDDMEDLMRQFAEHFSDKVETRVVREVTHGDKTYPIHALTIGSARPTDPAVGFFGGVHGLEKIGSEVVLAFMHTVLEQIKWDRNYRARFENSRLVFMPLINPVGIVNRTRSNGNGVDLMRNSPLSGQEQNGLAAFYGGHRFTPKLPWYRGPEGAEMEVEALAVKEVVEKELFTSPISMAIDVHSGFGARDRCWFPYAHSKDPFPYLSEAYGLKKLFDRTYAHHFYAFEPTSRQYTIHGDLWDYLFLENRKKSHYGFFIPFTLEMGSWAWLRKNPLQILSRDGIFHPMKAHRRTRILRRHINLFDFLHRAVLSPDAWRPIDQAQNDQFGKDARELWYAS
jgi:hypothetical protein